MALQPFANGQGVLVSPIPNSPFFDPVNYGALPINLAGYSLAAVGYLYLSSGPGTSKTISAAGSGKVHWLTGASITFANAGTTLRVGVQDVNTTTGIEDTTFDVYGDFVGGTDTITADAVNTVTMESGTKTITHGDLVAVVLEMTSRAGADTVSVVRATSSMVQPYLTWDNGSGPQRISSAAMVSIQFDDGTIGYFGAGFFALDTETPTAYGSSSTPDEHALVFRLPFEASATGLFAKLASMASGDDFELILYSDPLGTPVAERTITQDMDIGGGGLFYDRPFTTAYTLAANTDYAIALRPTTGNTLSYQRLTFGSGNGNLRQATMLGTNWYYAARTNQTGAFGSTDTTLLPLFGVYLGQLDDATGGGGGGGEVSHVFVG